MTTIRTSLIAAFGLLAAMSMSASPTEAGTLPAAKPTFDSGEASSVQLATDRGSWKKKKRRYRDAYDYDRQHRKHYKKHKKYRKYVKRGYRRGYNRGYDEGYFDGRRRSYFGRRHHHHHYYPDYGFRGGIYFGDGYFSGGGFRFRY